MRIIKIFCSLCIISITYGQFPSFPPDSVTSIMDRDQMVWQLDISFPDLPPKLQDTTAPPNSYPSDPLNPEGNWSLHLLYMNCMTNKV